MEAKYSSEIQRATWWCNTNDRRRYGMGNEAENVWADRTKMKFTFG
jgi:hypothetical protein